MHNNIFEINKNNINDPVTLGGWVKKSRRMGDLLFFDLRNDDKVVQVVVKPNSDAFEIANKLRSEYVVIVEGVVILRKNINPNLKTGEIEIDASKITIINKAKQLPLIIDDETDALEAKRLEYRYLDIRRSINNKNLKYRSKFNKLIRDFFYEKGFIEVETPIITKPTIGGAGEFKVISNNHKNKYYSLVQSPQIYKQLLMYGGIEKYFQIAKCFRDEDSRADRQLEFTQLDLEMSFTNEKSIRSLINELLIKITNDFTKYKINEFKQLSYKEAIEKYGSDKPDLRFDNKIFDITKSLKNTKVEYIQKLLTKGESVKAIYFEKNISNSKIKNISELIKSQGATNFLWGKVDNNGINYSFKDIGFDELNKIKETMSISEDGTILAIIDKEHIALEYLGRIRNMFAKEAKIIPEDTLAFAWVTHFPLFELSDEGQLMSMHNPFTAPSEKYLESFRNGQLSNEELLEIDSTAYDIVLNGSEIGGGSIRISNREDQMKVFEILGMRQKEIEESFGWMLEAQEYGIPTHGGIALGLDRILSILLKTPSIRDVIAFPKTSSGTDEMMKGPIEEK